MNRNLLLPLLLTAALGIPVIMMNDNSASPSSVLQAWHDSAVKIPSGSTNSGTLFPGTQSGPDLASGPLEFMPVADLAQIFRFDLSPAMITQRWDRVSTVGDDQGLRGLRVPFVSGTGPADVHGSLTYYFDGQGGLQRISFRGWCGDPANLVQVLQSNFGFDSQPTAQAGRYCWKRWGRLQGVCLLRYPGVVRADTPQQRLAIFLELANPEGRYRLSAEAERQYAADGRLQSAQTSDSSRR